MYVSIFGENVKILNILRNFLKIIQVLAKFRDFEQTFRIFVEASRYLRNKLN
jgi:hypothetical protein